MFEFEDQLRAADPVRVRDAAMPDFASMAQRISGNSQIAAAAPSGALRVKVGAGLLALALVAVGTLAILAPSPTPGARSARRVFWNLPTSNSTTAHGGGVVSGDNFNFLGTNAISSIAGVGLIYQVSSNLRPLNRFSVFAKAFGVSTAAGVTSTSQPEQVEVTAGDPSSASGQLAYWSYTGTNSVQYSFNQFHFVADDADSLLFSNQISTNVSYATQRQFLTLARGLWSSLKSYESLDTASATWQQVGASTSSGASELVTKVLIPLAIHGTPINQSVSFEFNSTGVLLSATGPDIVIARSIKVPFQSASAAIYEMNRGVNIPCVTIYSATSVSASGATTATTSGSSVRNVTLTRASVLYEAQRTSAKAVMLIPFYLYSGNLGATQIGGFLGSAAVATSHLSITKSPSGACSTTLLGS